VNWTGSDHKNNGFRDAKDEPPSPFSIRFGVPRLELGPSLVVLDKSFLDGVKPELLQYYVQQGWTFALPEVLMFELLYKRDRWRLADLFKLHRVEHNLVLLPGIGAMLRAEAEHLKPATTVLKAKSVQFIVAKDASGEYFDLDDPKTLASTAERTAETKTKTSLLIGSWRDFARLPSLQDAKPSEIPNRIQQLKEGIRDDIEDIRGFYKNHRTSDQPAPELLDDQWASFRQIQVLLFAGLDYFARYGPTIEPKADKINNEILDLDYLIPALLVGGLASYDKPLVQCFKFLCPKGIVLR